MLLLVELSNGNCQPLLRYQCKLTRAIHDSGVRGWKSFAEKKGPEMESFPARVPWG